MWVKDYAVFTQCRDDIMVTGNLQSALKITVVKTDKGKNGRKTIKLGEHKLDAGTVTDFKQ